MIVGLIIYFLCIQTFSVSIPELNIAASTFVVNQEIAKNLGPLIETKIT
jgi:hypothetical protein